MRWTSGTPRWGRGTPPRAGARSTRRSIGTPTRTGSSPWSRAAARASPTTTRSRRSEPQACWTSGWRPAAPTRSGCTWPPSGTRSSATSPTVRIPRWPSGSAWAGSGCTPPGSASPIRPTGGGSSSPAPTRTTWPARSRWSATRPDRRAPPGGAVRAVAEGVTLTGGVRVVAALLAAYLVLGQAIVGVWSQERFRRAHRDPGARLSRYRRTTALEWILLAVALGLVAAAPGLDLGDLGVRWPRPSAYTAVGGVGLVLSVGLLTSLRP